MQKTRLGIHRSGRINRSGRILALAAGLALVALPTVGCGGPGGGTPNAQDVASLVTASATAEDQVGSAAATAAGSGGGGGGSKAADPDVGADGRPQLRLDDSDEDINRKQRPYLLCMQENGHLMNKRGGGLSLDSQDDSPTAKKAAKACAGKLWRIPPEEDPERNPHFADDFRAQIKCLNTNGVPVKAIDDEGSYNYDGDSNKTAEQKAKIEQDCRMQAFGGKK
jgi:hypothetical protein